MSPVHHESAFGEAIVAAMLEHGWREGSPHGYRPDLALDLGELLTFIGETQPKEWDRLLVAYGGDPDAAQRGFAKRVDTAITSNGLIDVLRSGVKDRGVLIRLAYFKPNLVTSDAALDAYRANRLMVVRELAYATKHADAGNRLDLTLFLNGIPIATAELKNPLTGQNVEHAKAQYRAERDPSEPIFRNRVIANFAVDPDRVFVTTQLRGAKTRFLPFNTGSEGPGRPGGAGNPDPTTPGGYSTSYLWEQIWARNNWLDLLERFVHLQKSTAPGGGKSKTLIFPRYHQWDVVKKLTAHAAEHGAGHNYLVMASAGSGKSNTIGWLAHRLSDLHGADTNTVFDKVVVITDRRNLDAQLRETVGSFEQTAGLVVKIDKSHGTKSAQLAQALGRDTGRIVTVTLHTFPALMDYLRRNPTEISGSRFAIIIDEAHSSQSGDAATAVRAALRDLGLDTETDDDGATEVTVDAYLEQRAAARGRATNLSYFAFTATPKAKTLELFGTLDADNPGADGSPVYRPFHTYSMRQAIEEGFILDPLRNYITYQTYWQLVSKNPHDAEVDPAKANAELARYAVMHPSTVEQQAQVIVEHFVADTRGRLGGRAKAMVVTASRISAVQMARAIRRYLADRDYDKRYPDIGVLVAFSGTLSVEGEETTEPKENGGLAESALPKAFHYTRADDVSTRSGGPGQREYRILVVAEKYQTGFDEPLLTTMYVNKKLAGIAAVQTLSRLNRTGDGKSQGDLAVIDFVNDAGDIQDAFRPYFEEADTLPTEPNLLYTAQDRVMRANILVLSEMREFVTALMAAGDDVHADLYRHLSPAVARFIALADSEDEDEDDRQTAEDFRADLNDFVRKYAFLAQIIPYRDADLEQLYLYGRHLLNRLPHRESGGVDIGEIDLTHLRVQHTGDVDVSLQPEGSTTLRGFGDGTGGAVEPEKSLLSELIERFNVKHGTDLTEKDLLVPYTEATDDLRVRRAAVANDEDNFGVVFDEVFEEKMADHIDTITDVGNQYFGHDKSFRSNLNASARRAAWRLIRQEEGVA